MDFTEWVIKNAYQDSPCIIVDKLPKQVLAFTKPSFDGSNVGVYVNVKQVHERDELIRDMMELDQMRHGPFSWERQEKMQDLRGSVNARLIKMGFVQEVEG